SLPRSFDKDEYLISFLDHEAGEKVLAATREDEDISLVSTSVVPGVQGSLLLCRVQLNRGAHPERSLDIVVDQLLRIWEPAASGSACQPNTVVARTELLRLCRPSNTVVTHLVDDVSFQERQRSAVVNMVLGFEDLIERGIKRATLTHFSQDRPQY